MMVDVETHFLLVKCKVSDSDYNLFREIRVSFLEVSE